MKTPIFRHSALLINWSIIILMIISLACFVIGENTRRILLAIAGIPAFVFINTLIHEAGHIVTCLLSGNKIQEVKLCFLVVSKDEIRTETKYILRSYCKFKTSENDAMIYLGGIIFSLALFTLLLCRVILARDNCTAIYAFISAFSILQNVIPRRGNDMTAFLYEVLKRRNNK